MLINNFKIQALITMVAEDGTNLLGVMLLLAQGADPAPALSSAVNSNSIFNNLII